MLREGYKDKKTFNVLECNIKEKGGRGENSKGTKECLSWQVFGRRGNNEKKSGGEKG